MCSPLHAVMNFGFVAMGLGIAVAVSLLAIVLPLARRVVLTILGCILAFGMILVATFPGGVESLPDGTIVLHVLGDAAAISIGNVLAIVVGSNRRRLSFPSWYGLTSILLGTIGLVVLLLLLGDAGFLDPAVSNASRFTPSSRGS